MDLFCERLVFLLNKKGIDDKKIERDLSLPKDSIYNWKHNITKSYTKFISKIAAYLEVSALYLLGETDDPTPKEPATAEGDGLSEAQRELIDLWDKASPEHRKLALDLLRLP